MSEHPITTSLAMSGAGSGGTTIRVESDSTDPSLAAQFDKAFQRIEGILNDLQNDVGQAYEVTDIVAKVGVRRPPPPHGGGGGGVGGQPPVDGPEPEPAPGPGPILGDPGDGEAPGQGSDQGIDQGPDDGPVDPDQPEPDTGPERPRPKVG